MSGGPRVEIVIDRLVVHGADRAQAVAVQRALTTHLEALAQGWLDGSTAPPPQVCRPPPVAIQVPAGRRGRDLGRHAADAVFATVAAPSPAGERHRGRPQPADTP
ncbi:MAG: hypothetical protein KY434_10840 [Actinobacteria bacterium]|nr:hypothetical protein [Actinomycetota bacterium]